MIEENISRINEEIHESAKKAGKNPADIKLVAVSKRFPAARICEAFRAGQLLFGENYIQEVQEKIEEIPADAKIHFIGHLQSNKAKIAAAFCDMVETVDTLKLGRKLNSQLEETTKKLKVLVQVNIGGDPKKAGTQGDQTEQLLAQLSELKNLEVRGLMTMPPFETDPENSRPYFEKLRRLSEKLSAGGMFPRNQQVELSMGMSNDFRIAIEEGATIIRVGTAIFGKRP